MIKKSSTKRPAKFTGSFKDILLIVVYHHPIYASFHRLRRLYEVAFPHVVLCGPEKHQSFDTLVVKHNTGLLAYECMRQAMVLRIGFHGYLYFDEELILNWWTLGRYDWDKIWTGSGPPEIEDAVKIGGEIPAKAWGGWKEQDNLEHCHNAYMEMANKGRIDPKMKQFVETHRHNGNYEKFCYQAWSDIFYIPRKFRESFIQLSTIYYKFKVNLEIAVPMIVISLDLRQNIETLDGLYMPDKYGIPDFSNGVLFWREYNFHITFLGPFRRHNLHRETVFLTKDIFKKFIMAYVKLLISKNISNEGN